MWPQGITKRRLLRMLPFQKLQIAYCKIFKPFANVSQFMDTVDDRWSSHLGSEGRTDSRWLVLFAVMVKERRQSVEGSSFNQNRGTCKNQSDLLFICIIHKYLWFHSILVVRRIVYCLSTNRYWIFVVWPTTWKVSFDRPTNDHLKYVQKLKLPS